jgi:hypothetical protein
MGGCCFDINPSPGFFVASLPGMILGIPSQENPFKDLEPLENVHPEEAFGILEAIGFAYRCSRLH